MTSTELSNKLCKKYDIHEVWPTTYEVDSVTYANVCQHCFDRYHIKGQPRMMQLALGPNGGILFHSVELILKVNRKWPQR